MPDSFGARMREQRERHQVALSTIAEQTKIKVSLLEALERDDVSRWPSGIFRRAFIRAYAHAIGLEPDVVVRDFLELYPDPPEAFADTAMGVDDGRATDGASMRLRYLVASAIGSVSRLRPRPIARPEFQVDTMPSLPEMNPYTAPPIQDLTRDVDGEAVQTHASVQEPAVEPLPLSTDGEPPATSAVSVQLAPPSAPGEPAVTPEVPATVSAPQTPDLMAVAHLCTELGRVHATTDVPPLLQEMTRVLGAVGVIIWVWDPMANELRPAFAHGYSDRVVAQLPRVDRDTNNATAAAFRAARTCVVKGNDIDNGALAVPLMGPEGCVGVLATELTERREERESVRAAAMIVAAQLATLAGTSHPMEGSGRRFA